MKNVGLYCPNCKETYKISFDVDLDIIYCPACKLEAIASAMPSDEVLQEVREFITKNIQNWINDYLAINLSTDDPVDFQVTFAISEDGSQWNYQTGDNSYTGGAYGLPNWAVVYITEDSTVDALMQDIEFQWNDLLD